MQAARGTPVATPGTGGRSRLPLLFATVGVLGYFVDQGSKALAVARLEGRPDVQVIGEVLQLHLTRNPGAAFSTGTAFTPVLTCVAIVAALTVLWFARRVGSIGWAVAMGLLLAGVTGNLTDRLLRAPGAFEGHVVDFLRLPNWPIFNVADMCINVAAALILLQAFRGVRLDGTTDRDAAAQDTEDAEDDPDDDPDEGIEEPAQERAE